MADSGGALADQIVEAWEIHSRIVLYVLDAIPAEALAGVSATGKGRSVGAQLAHLHNVRLMWLKSAAPALLDSLESIDAANTTDKDALRSALEASANAVATLLRQALESSGKIKGFKPHTADHPTVGRARLLGERLRLGEAGRLRSLAAASTAAPAEQGRRGHRSLPHRRPDGRTPARPRDLPDAPLA
jgi:uncharacterized damage-inducible protein DinB